MNGDFNQSDFSLENESNNEDKELRVRAFLNLSELLVVLKPIEIVVSAWNSATEKSVRELEEDHRMKLNR